MLLFISFIITIIIPAPTIVIDIQAENGAAIVGLTVEFRDESGELTGSCVSDENGRCTIPLSGELAEGQIVRGVLDFGASGVRSLIWMTPEQPRVTIILDEFGKIDLPHHDEHPTPDSFSDTSPTPLPAAAEPTEPPQYATTEYVIIDPTAPDDMPTIIAVEEAPTTAEIIFSTATAVTPTKETEATTQPRRAWWSIIAVNLIFASLWIGGIWYYRRRHKDSQTENSSS